MNLRSKIQQQRLLNMELQRLVDASIQQAQEIKTSADNAIKPAGLNAGLATKADLVHTHTLSNLTQSGATLNQVPQWSGSAWVPATVSSASNVEGGNASSIPVVGLTYDGGSA
jgi:uncharacterized protein YgiB involved in biofilm formation